MWIASLIAMSAPAELVIDHARIWSDGQFVGSWMTVKGSRILAVGRGNAPAARKRVDAGGRVVTPGFIDSHSHLLENAGDFHRLDLSGAHSKNEFIRMVATAAAKLKPGEWLTGTGWSTESYPEREQPTRAWIDAVTGDHPTVLTRMDGHSVVCNTLALRRSKITRERLRDPAGGVIDRDPQGEPTGVLRESAIGLVNPPDAPLEEVRKGFHDEITMANRFGVTAVSDICGPAFATRFSEAVGDDRRMRFSVYVRGGESIVSGNAALLALQRMKRRPDWVEPRGVKLFADGSIGSRSAWMKAPFNQAPEGKPKEWRGVPYPGMLDGSYEKIIGAATDRGWQVIIHAIGDQANARVLDFFEKVPSHETRRLRIEHAQHLAPEDVARFGKLGVIASMQPYHKADDGRYAEDVIGEKRCETSYAYRSLLTTGAKLAFGSDYPVVTIDPLAGVRTAVTGVIATGKVWQPAQNISATEAFRAYTSVAAFAMKMDDRIGALEPGKLADFVILDGDPFAAKVDWKRVRVAQTFVGGRRAFPR